MKTVIIIGGTEAMIAIDIGHISPNIQNKTTNF